MVSPFLVILVTTLSPEPVQLDCYVTIEVGVSLCESMVGIVQNCTDPEIDGTGTVSVYRSLDP